MSVFQGDLWNTMEPILNSIAQDMSDVDPRNQLMERVFKQKSSQKAQETILEMAGPGLASEKPEGMEMATGDLTEGFIATFFNRTYALRLIITEEAVEDTRYKEVLQLARRLKGSCNMTVQYDAANMFARGFNTAFPINSTGVNLWSASHQLATGGAFSNTLPTPLAPSMAALIDVETEARRMPNHQGLPGGYMIDRIICPVDQWAVWAGIIGSTHNPEAGEFNEINVTHSSHGYMRLTKGDVVANPFWANTTTNWAVRTTAENGFIWFWRRKMRNNTWVENSQMMAHHAISYRSSRGCADPRATIGSEA